MTNTQNRRYGVTLLIVLALMVMFAMLVVAFMVIVSQQRRTAEFNAQFLINPPEIAWTDSTQSILQGNRLDRAFQQLLTGSPMLDNVIAPHSILENLYGSPGGAPFSGTGAGYDPGSAGGALLSVTDGDGDTGKPFALRPNILAPSANGVREYIPYLQGPDGFRMNPDYTAPDFMTMFLAWNDFRGGTLQRIIPSFHRPQLVRYWNPTGTISNFNELRKYVLRPLPTDHPDFTGSNPAATVGNLFRFLTEGPWDVDNDGDGIADGIWLDIGLPLISTPRNPGVYYKPLVSYYVIDLDGRINVNTIGNTGQSPPDGSARGMGLGPAELSSDLLPPNIWEQIMTGDDNHDGRYGSDNMPGDVSLSPAELLQLLKDAHGINLDAYNRGGLVADWFGLEPIGFDNLGNRISAPPLLGNDIRNIPYLMNPYSGTHGDTPFDSGDFASLAHSVIEFDYDSMLSPHRFRDLLDDSYDSDNRILTEPALRYNLATRSSDIPVAARHLPVVDASGNVTYETLERRARELGMWYLLPVEIREGRKVNLNRLTLYPLCVDVYPTCDLCDLDEQGVKRGCPLWNQHWNPNATEVARNALLVEKFKFAQEVFCLLRVLLHDQIQDIASLERLAQWSVNLVDFIDPDDVMTPFIFRTDGSPEDGTSLTLIQQLLAGTLEANNPALNNYMLIWGFENPEVALTETLAIHDRRVKRIEGPLERWQQTIRPQGSLFVELYRQGDPQRINTGGYQASSLVEPNGALNLARRTGNSADGDYVWRLAIGEATKTVAGKFDWDGDDAPEKNALRQLLTPASGVIRYPQFYQWSSGTTGRQYRSNFGLGRPERFIWFGREFPTERPFTPSGVEIQRRSFVRGVDPDDGSDTLFLQPDSFLVIMPPELSEEELSLELPFVSLPTPLPPNVATMIATNRIEVNVKYVPGSGNITGVIGVNVSEPLLTVSLSDGYGTETHPPDTNTPIFDRGQMSVDGQLVSIHRQLGTIACFKTIGLQRLADPNRPHHPIRNPYITVDWSMIDLHVINSSNDQSDHPEPNTHVDSDPRFTSRQWNQEDTASNFANLWDRTLGTSDLGDQKAGLPTGGSSSSFIHSLGVPNFSASRFLHFPWHDAPLMNTGELMLVPASAPGRFGIEFHDSGSNNFFGTYDWLAQTGPDTDRPRFGYHYEGATFGLYPNWAGNHLAGPPALPSQMVRLFDFVHVPTKFAGTRAPDGTVVREPGKFNLNTVTEAGWEALRSGRSDFPSYADFFGYRELTGNYPSEFRPFRSPSAVNLVPPGAWMENAPSDATLFRLEELIVDDAINPYLALENAMRLSDVTTTRSNVFAIWITVGYFNVEKFDTYTDFAGRFHSAGRLLHINSSDMFEAVYPGGYVLGAEKGLNDGTVIRHRAFYLIDRSIPVDNFDRGINLDDVKNVIIREISL